MRFSPKLFFFTFSILHRQKNFLQSSPSTMFFSVSLGGNQYFAASIRFKFLIVFLYHEFWVDFILFPLLIIFSIFIFISYFFLCSSHMATSYSCAEHSHFNLIKSMFRLILILFLVILFSYANYLHKAVLASFIKKDFFLIRYFYVLEENQSTKRKQYFRVSKANFEKNV